MGGTRLLAAVLAVAGLAACAAATRRAGAHRRASATGPGRPPRRRPPDRVLGEGRRGLAVRTSFPTTPSDRAVAAVQALLVRVARGPGSGREVRSGPQAPGGAAAGVGDLDPHGGQLVAQPVGGGEVRAARACSRAAISSAAPSGRA